MYGQSIDIIETPEKTYYYSTDWRDKLIDSSFFHTRMGHENPKMFPIKTHIQTASRVYIGRLELGKTAKSEITDYIDVTSDTRPDDSSIKLHQGLYYHCNDVFSPEIGDIRLRFLTAGIEGNYVSYLTLPDKFIPKTYRPLQFILILFYQYTVVGKFENGQLVPYVSSLKNNVLIILPGRHTLNEAFDAAHYERKLHSWALRFIGWVFIFFATICTTELMNIVLSDIPFFAILLPNPQHPMYGMILLSASTALTIISISWLIFRPWLAVGMFCAAISPFIFCAHSLLSGYQRVNTQLD